MFPLCQEPLYDADITLLRTDVEIILSDLTAREAAVLRMRFGIGGLTPSTLESVGRRLCVTRERVRQIQVGALEKLRGTAPTHGGLYADRAVRRTPREWKKRKPLPNSLLLELVEQSRDPELRGGGGERGRERRGGVGGLPRDDAGLGGLRRGGQEGGVVDLSRNPRLNGREEEEEEDGVVGHSRDARLNGRKAEQEGVVGQSIFPRTPGKKNEQGGGEGEEEQAEVEEMRARRRALEADRGGGAASAGEGRRRINGDAGSSAGEREGGASSARNVFSSLQSA